jgi:hypothetical protein
MPEDEYDLIVIGAGPAGLMWASTAIDAGKKVLLIDQGIFHQPNYSSINLPLSIEPKVGLGGIGGTANAWQGQCVELDEKQFGEIFRSASGADYGEYLRESKIVQELLGIKIGHRSSKFIKRARKELHLRNDINVKYSYIPMILDLKTIFRNTLLHNNLKYLEMQVTSLGFNDKRLTEITSSNKAKIVVGTSTKVALATNAVSTAKLLKEANSFLKYSNNEEILVYDHPWRTKNRYSAKDNKFVRRKLFSYHVGRGYRMKIKLKFEVDFESKPLGVFELRPVFEGSILYKILVRGTQKIFGISILPPTHVDVWCQISQSKPLIHGTYENLENALDPEDLQRLHLLEETSKKKLLETGFKYLSEIQPAPIEQAFHTTGTVAFSSIENPQLFKYPGVAEEIRNFYVSGTAVLGNCSWVNPTFSSLVIASLNAKKVFY